MSLIINIFLLFSLLTEESSETSSVEISLSFSSISKLSQNLTFKFSKEISKGFFSLKSLSVDDKDFFEGDDK